MTYRWPRVPETRLDAGEWQLADRTRERLFELPRVTVEGHTLMYEEPSVSERLDTDEPLCFFFATRLGFEPNLPSGAARLVEPLIRRRARSQFLETLRERSFTGLDSRTRDDFRTSDGHDGQRTTVRGRCRVADRSIEATGLLAVWRADGFFVAGGGYPHLEGDDERAYRAELSELLRNVS